jgi:RHS repeat-associated protein
MDVGGARVWSYYLEYDEYAGMSHLRNIWHCDAGASRACMSPTEIHYDSGETQLFSSARNLAGDHNMSDYFGNGVEANKTGNTVVLDVNGDGRDDLLAPRYMRTAPNGFGIFNYHLLIATADPANPFQAPIDTGIWAGDGVEGGHVTSVCLSQSSVIDWNNDGRDDLVSNCLPRLTPAWNVYLSTGNGLSPIPLVFRTDDKLFASSRLHVADMDGDGWEDILLCDTKNWKLYLSPGAGGFQSLSSLPAPRVFPQPGSGACEETMELLVDIDGDGVVNLMSMPYDPLQESLRTSTAFNRTPKWKALVIRSATSAEWVDAGFDPPQLTPESVANLDQEYSVSVVWDSHIPTLFPFVSWWQLKPVDFNGDGLTDFVHYLADAPVAGNRIALYTNTGRGFTRSVAPFKGTSQWPWYTPDSYSFYRMQVLDIDHDGRQDLIMPVGNPRQPQNIRWVALRSVGRDGPFQATELSSAGWDLDPAGVPIALDQDGDGDKELIIPLEQPNPPFAFVEGSVEANHLLTGVVDGLGKRQEIVYARTPEMNQSVYTPTADCPDSVRCLRRMPPLVGVVKTYEPLMGVKRSPDAPSAVTPVTVHRITQAEHYTYLHGHRGLYQRGWLGFSVVNRTLKDDQGKTIETTLTTLDNVAIRLVDPKLPGRYYYPYAHIPMVESKTYAAAPDTTGALTERVQVTAHELSTQLSADKRPFAAVRSTLVVDTQRGPDGTTTPASSSAQLFDTDPYGMTTRVQTTWKSGANAVLETHTVATPHTVSSAQRSAWLIRLPDSRIEESAIGAETARREEVYQYLSTGSVARVTRQPNIVDVTQTNAVEYLYDRFGNMRQKTEAAPGIPARVTLNVYDARGLNLTTTTAGGLTTSLSFDPSHGELLSETDPNNIVTRRTAYDGFARPATVTELGSVTTYSYDRPAYETFDPLLTNRTRMRIRAVANDGAQREQILDGDARVIQERVAGYNGTWATNEIAYDWAGRVAHESRPHLVGDATQGYVDYVYDVQGRLTERRSTEEGLSSNLSTTTYRYGLAAKQNRTGWNADSLREAIYVVSAIDPNLSVERRFVGHRGQVIVARDAGGGVSQYRYGPFGTLRTIHDPANNVTSLEYDALGRRKRLVDLDRGPESLLYDGFDRIRNVTDPAGPTQYTYDALDRLTLRTDPDRQRSVFVYDGAGPGEKAKLVEARTETEAQAVTTRTLYAYHGAGSGAGLLRSRTQTAGGLSLQTQYGYDAFSRVELVTYPPADAQVFRVRNVYDTRGHLSKVRDDVSGTDYWAFGEHDQGYRLGSERFGNGTQTRWSYEPLSGRVKGILTSQTSNGAGLNSTEYSYDSRGNVRAIVDEAGTRTFSHDALNRLTHMWRAVPQAGGLPPQNQLIEQITYNAIGNIMSRTDAGTFTYGSPRPHAVTATSTGAAYDYDAMGNQVVRTGGYLPGGSQTIVYGAFNLPLRISAGTGRVVDITYDAERTRVYTASNQGDKAWFTDDFYEREQKSGLIRHRYRIYSGEREIAQVIKDQSAAGAALASSVRYLVGDLVGSAEAVTAGASSVTRNEFSPFGKLATDTLAPLGVSAGFAGHRHDPGLGIIDMKGRYYDPHLGRFLSPDPIIQEPFNTQALNRYSYVLNRPLTMTDPTGFEYDAAASAVSGRPVDFEEIPGGMNWKPLEVKELQERPGGPVPDLSGGPSAMPWAGGGSHITNWMPPMHQTVADNNERWIREFAINSALALIPVGRVIKGAASAAGAVATRIGPKVASLLAKLRAARATRAGRETFEILDGVRRAKAAELAGRTTIRAEVEVAGKTVRSAEIPLEQLRSPFKSAIDVSSSPAQAQRFQQIMQGTQAGSKLPSIRVQPGSRGPSIVDVFFE